jgi:DNA recombination-dependent growth factor C
VVKECLKRRQEGLSSNPSAANKKKKEKEKLPDKITDVLMQAYTLRNLSSFVLHGWDIIL